MNFFDFIEKLRNKPESTRKKIAFIATFLITGVIAIIWLSVFFVNQKEVKKENYHSPFSIIKEVIK